MLFPAVFPPHSRQVDKALSDTTIVCTLPTIWGLLSAKSVSATYYNHDVPFTALYGNPPFGAQIVHRLGSPRAVTKKHDTTASR